MSEDLEQRLRAIEDRIAIQDLIARYGPAVDAGIEEKVSELWDDDGWYRIDGAELTAPGIGSLVHLDTHRDYLDAGCAHLLSAPRVEIDGETAVAVNHSCVLTRSDGQWNAVRVSANRWELVRTSEGWRVHGRTARLLDGSTDARALLS